MLFNLNNCVIVVTFWNMSNKLTNDIRVKDVYDQARLLSRLFVIRHSKWKDAEVLFQTSAVVEHF